MIFSTLGNGQSSTNLGTVCAESSEYYGVEGYSDSDFIWAVEGGVIVEGDGKDTINIKWGYQTGTYKMEVQEITVSGCSGIPMEAFVEVTAPLVDIGPDFMEVCEPDSFVFDARGDYFEPYLMRWQDGTYSANYTAKQTGLVWVKVTDGRGCERYDTVNFTAHPLLQVDLGNDTLLCDEEVPMQLDAGDYSFYRWESTSGISYTGNPYYMFPPKPVMDTLMVTVTDIHGCEMSDTIVVYPCNIAQLFKGMPNTITPGVLDGNNDYWVIPYIENFPDAVLEIFDRWGRLVHHEEDFPGGVAWDGKSKGRDMPMDSYYFVLELNYMHVEPITGTINLIR